MIVSKFGKSYDTSNGSEQQQPQRPTEAKKLSSSDAESQRWADDGGPKAEQLPVVTHATRPVWSTRSLQALNSAIEQTAADEPKRKNAERVRNQRRLDHVRIEMKASRDRALRHWHRNPWENT